MEFSRIWSAALTETNMWEILIPGNIWMNGERRVGVNTNALLTPLKRPWINRFSLQGHYLLFSPTQNDSLLKAWNHRGHICGADSWRAAWPFWVLKEQTECWFSSLGPLILTGGDVAAAYLQTLIRWPSLGTWTDNSFVFSHVFSSGQEGSHPEAIVQSHQHMKAVSEAKPVCDQWCVICNENNPQHMTVNENGFGDRSLVRETRRGPHQPPWGSPIQGLWFCHVFMS